MQEIGDRLEAAACVYPATIDGHAALFNAIGERDEHAADDLVFLWERCVALEALALELAGLLSAATARIADGAVKDMHRAALSSPLLAELRAKEAVLSGKEPHCHTCAVQMTTGCTLANAEKCGPDLSMWKFHDESAKEGGR
jgi:hypothetical protein